MTCSRFEELPVWQDAIEPVEDVIDQQEEKWKQK
jgi:hypothetical protein